MGEINLEEMTIEELDAWIEELMAQVRGIRQQQREAQAVLNRKRLKQQLGEKIAGLSNDERAALAQVLAARGVESGEEFGEF